MISLSADIVINKIKDLGCECFAWEADLSEPGNIPKMFDLAEEKLGKEILVDEVFKELGSFIEVLEIPPEQVQITAPEDSGKVVGIFLPHEISYGELLQIALYRKGFKAIKFSSFSDQALTKNKFDFNIGDLSSVEKPAEIKEFQESLDKLSDKCIILPSTDKDGKPYNLDFFWLEKQIEKCSET